MLIQKKLLLVEDDESLGETLKQRLVKEGYSVFWEKSIASAKKTLSEILPHLVILDLRLSDGSGFDLAIEIKKSTGVPFLFLSAHSGAQERLKGFELGGMDFIPKPFHLKELLLRIEKCIQETEGKRETVLFAYKNFLIDPLSHEIQTKQGESFAVSDREIGLLCFLIRERKRSINRSEILDRIWGEEKFPTERTIDNSIVKLRSILGKDAIESIRGVGYRFIGEIQEKEL